MESETKSGKPGRQATTEPYPKTALERERNLIEVLKKELKEFPWSKETKADLAKHKAILRAMERRNFLSRQLSLFPKLP